MIDNKLSTIAKYNFMPDFMRYDYPQFTSFISEYFKSMENPDQVFGYLNRFLRNLDIDDADDDFISDYISEFAGNFPKQLLIDDVQLLKIISHFYLASGSEDSFNFLFRLMYDADVDVEYPREVLYRPSSGVYLSDIVIYITGEHFFKLPTLSENLNASITGKVSGAVAIIDSISSINRINGVLVLQLDISSINGTLIQSEGVLLQVESTIVEETVVTSITNINITDIGVNYSTDDTITITDVTGRGAFATIESTSKGKYDSYTILNGGVGYSIGDQIRIPIVDQGFGFRATITNVDGFGEILSVRIDDGGYLYSSASITISITSQFNGINANIVFNGNSIGNIKTVKLQESGYNYSSTPILTINTSNGTGATLTPILGTIFNTPPVVKSDISSPSSRSKILDSNYYQIFSYVLRSKIAPITWLDKVKRINHAAGSKLFGMYQLTDEIDLSVSVIDSGISPNRTNVNISFFDDIGDVEVTNNIMLGIMSTHNSIISNNLETFDGIKFFDGFNHTLDVVQDESIDSLINNSSIYMESSTITITP